MRARTLVIIVALIAGGCSPALKLSVKRVTLETADIECAVAPTQPGPNQIQLRVTVDPPCDIPNLDFEVLADEWGLARGSVGRPLRSGVRDYFDTPPFARPRSRTLLTVQATGACADKRPLTAADQCRVP